MSLYFGWEFALFRGMEPEPTRIVEWADALPWMRARGRIEGACAVTSLPDVSEVNLSLPAWRTWFLEAVGLVVGSVPEEKAALQRWSATCRMRNEIHAEPSLAEALAAMAALPVESPGLPDPFEDVGGG